MPQLPPGSANPVSLPPNSTWIFTPNPLSGGINSVSIWNTGTRTAYIGKAGVNQADGFPIQPGNRPVRLQNIGYTLYGVCDVAVGALAGTLNTSYSAGTTTIVTAASVSTAVATTGATLIVGSTVNTGWEAVVINTISTSYTTFGTTALVSDHFNTSSPVYAGTALATSVVVQAGML